MMTTKVTLLQMVRNVCTPLEKREKQRSMLVTEFYRRVRAEKKYKDKMLYGLSWEKPKEKPTHHFTDRRMSQCGLSPKVFQTFLDEIVQQELKGHYTYYLLRDGLDELLDMSFEERMQHHIEHIKNRFLSKADRLQKFNHHINEYLAYFRQNIYDDESNPEHQAFFNEMLNHHWLEEADVDRAGYDQRLKKIGEKNRRDLKLADEYASIAGDPDWLGYQAEQQFYYETGERDTAPNIGEYASMKRAEREEDQIWELKKQVGQIFGRQI